MSDAPEQLLSVALLLAAVAIGALVAIELATPSAEAHAWVASTTSIIAVIVIGKMHSFASRRGDA